MIAGYLHDVAQRDLVDIYERLVQVFDARVRAVEPAQWMLATPCLSWDVAALVWHQTVEHRWAEPLLRGLNLEHAAAEVDKDGVHEGDLVSRWEHAAKLSVAAFAADGALQRPVILIRGRTTGDGYLRELIFDLTIHSWDLERALGYPTDLPADIVTAVWEESRQFTDLSAGGMFDTPVAVPDTAPVLDRLVALTGRDPAWTPPD